MDDFVYMLLLQYVWSKLQCTFLHAMSTRIIIIMVIRTYHTPQAKIVGPRKLYDSGCGFTARGYPIALAE